jgi:hypothetical protein
LPNDEGLITVTYYPFNPITAKRIIHAPSLPEYPITDLQGIAYVIDLRGMTQEEKKAQIANVIHSESILNPFLIHSRSNMDHHYPSHVIIQKHLFLEILSVHVHYALAQVSNAVNILRRIFCYILILM